MKLSLFAVSLLIILAAPVFASPDIQKCVVDDYFGVLSWESWAWGYYFGAYSVVGSFSFVDTGDDGWLGDVELYAVDDHGDLVYDIVELFHLPEAAVYMENNTYSFPYANHTGGLTLTIQHTTEGRIILEGLYYSPCCDFPQYTLYCEADVTDHSICTTLPASDINKDCKVNMQDFTIKASEWVNSDLQDLATMASEWMDCNLKVVAECFN